MLGNTEFLINNYSAQSDVLVIFDFMYVQDAPSTDDALDVYSGSRLVSKTNSLNVSSRIIRNLLISSSLTFKMLKGEEIKLKVIILQRKILLD